MYERTKGAHRTTGTAKARSSTDRYEGPILSGLNAADELNSPTDGVVSRVWNMNHTQPKKLPAQAARPKEVAAAMDEYTRAAMGQQQALPTIPSPRRAIRSTSSTFRNLQA